MHVFFESVWKLHIGEIPARPDAATASIRSQMDYAAAIAAIKQNALTVGNPEIIKKEVSIREWYHDNQPVPDRFYFWPGGADILEKIPPVAILTLPEEKKNTMENMTKELDELLQIYLPDEYYEDIRKNLIPALTRWKAIGSVAAPKEEGSAEPYFHLSKNEYGKMWLMYKPEGDGRYRCWEPITEEFWNEFEKLLR